MKFQLLILALALFQVSLGQDSQETGGEQPVGGRGWIDKFAGKTKEVIQKTSDIYKNTAGLWGDVVKKNTEIGKKVSDFNTDMGKNVVGGMTGITKEVVKGWADVWTGGNNIAKDMAGLVPGRFGKGMQSALDWANQQISKGQGKADELMDKMNNQGQKVLDLANSKATSVADKVNEMAQTGVKKVQDTVSQVEDKLVGDGTVAGLTSYKLKGLHGEAQ